MDIENTGKDAVVYPIYCDPTWDIVDPSKMNDFIRCHRMYFFRHLLGWDLDTPNNHLAFGEAWHVAMEHLLLNGYSEVFIAQAFDKFLSSYREKFPADTDTLFGAKAPERVIPALLEYATKYADDLALYKVLYTEVAGTVPITKEHVLHFRIDSILQDSQERIRSMEHKTKGGSINTTWYNQWPMSLQIGTYHHVLYCLYPEADVDGIWVNGAGFLKTKFDFQRLPVKKTREQMQVWLDTVNFWFNRLNMELKLLEDCSDKDNTLLAFPLNPSGCDKYFGCAYLDYCMAWPNPLRECDEVPLGFKQEFWDPSKKVPTTKMDL